MNELTPQEVAEYIEAELSDAGDMIDSKAIAVYSAAASIVRQYANGELRRVVHCGECKKSAKCYIKGVFPYPEYCSVGERNEGAE